jgi:hypothetical protein
MKKEQKDYARDYIHIEMRKNKSEHKSAPDYVAHSITSAYLKDYIQYCVKNNKEIAFDFAINEKNTDKCLLVLSVPYFEKRKPTTLFDHIEERDTHAN